MQGEIEIGGIADSGEHVPGRGNGEQQQDTGHEAEPAPRFPVEKAPRESQIQDRGARGEDRGDQSLEQQTGGDGGPQEHGPGGGMPLALVQTAQEPPHRQRNGERQDDIGDEDPGEQEQADRGGDAQARVKAGAPAEGPGREARGYPAEQNGGQRDRNARRPVVYAEDPVGDGDHPVHQRRLFEVRDAVQMGGDPVARLEHVARDLRERGIHVVHEGRRADDSGEKNRGGEEDDDHLIASSGVRREQGPAAGVSIRSLLSQKKCASRPHR